MAAFGSRPPIGAITYHHAKTFFFGVAAVTAGVALHLPMYFGAADMHYRLVGMSPDAPMLVGMALIVVGLAATAYGLLPRLAAPPVTAPAVRVAALDDAPIRPAHVALLVVMAVAVTIDVMKPTTLGFVTPGMAKEYGLKSPLHPHGSVPVALLPLAGITGTVVGSLMWGWLGDRIGRRPSILLAAVIFVATSICGAMPSYEWNFVMCFMMGLGAGGMLPIMFALIAETIPARHRGWLLVLIGGDAAGAYILTSWLASSLTPHYGWRILWLIGLPTGVLLVLLNRWIPESPRFLIGKGREAEAAAVMARYGASITPQPGPGVEIEQRMRDRWTELFRPPMLAPTLVIALFATGVGVVTFGFQLWIPTNLQKLGFTEVTSAKILRDSALIGFPVTFVTALLYGFWSSKRTIILLTIATAAALVGFVVAGDGVASHRALLYALLAVPIAGITSLLAAVIAYSAELYPTKLRSRGVGLGAGASKAGGVAVIAIVVASFAPPSISMTALLGAIPLVVAAAMLAVLGIETRRRPLEDITAEELSGLAVTRMTVGDERAPA